MQRGMGVLLKALVLWLGVLAYLALVAHAKRLAWQDRLAAEVVQRAAAGAERGEGDWTWPYLYGDWTGMHYQTSWQGAAVYLIERGRRLPALERSVLLLEARRTSPKVALSPWCWNWDLRRFLIPRCLKAYSDDSRVAWAAGRIYLTAGRFEQAAQQFKRVLDSGVDVATFGDEAPDRLRGRYLLALTMLNREGEAQAYVAQQAQAAPHSADARFTWLDYLCQRGEYARVSELALAARRDFPGDARFTGLLQRAAWWGGDTAGYRRLVLAQRGPGAGAADAYYADARLALLDGDFAAADRLLQWPAPAALKAYAEAYGVSRDPALLKRLQQLHAALQTPPGLTRDDPEYWDYYAERQQDAGVRSAIARARILAREWEAAGALAQTLDSAMYDGYMYELADYASLDSAWILSTLALGQPLRAKRLQGLQWAGTAGRLLRSDDFAAALAAGGRDRAEAVAWVRLLAQPELQTYSDSGNGEFDP